MPLIRALKKHSVRRQSGMLTVSLVQVVLTWCTILVSLGPVGLSYTPSSTFVYLGTLAACVPGVSSVIVSVPILDLVVLNVPIYLNSAW